MKILTIICMTTHMYDNNTAFYKKQVLLLLPCLYEEKVYLSF